MCVCVGRVSSTWSEAPIAAGGRPALRDGRRKLHESLYVALVRGDVREKKNHTRRDRCVHRLSLSATFCNGSKVSELV